MWTRVLEHSVGDSVRFTMHHTVLLASLLAAPQAVRGQGTPLTGCYEFPPHTFGISAGPAAELIELTSSPRDRDGWFYLRVPGLRDGSMLRDYANSGWKQVAPDSVRLAWGNGHSGVGLYLHIRGDSLVGSRAQSVDLVGDSGAPSRPVRGRRVPCPVVPPSEGAT